ncbi:MAG: glucose 1-dehydrogenase [Verrucomicrobia bacterium]|jgi:NAD(P)-dependent dehydrogenase (short-subunit alcohol dehydrogenase family)|nr:glucose 1-dehydrogenase [Verrucomicrobiota bacterium]
MPNCYTNKVVLVVGGTSGIGKATALAFAEAGAKVVITGRREKEGSTVAAQITKTGGTAAFFRADVVQNADVAKTIDFVQSTYGRLDVAFNNAGVEFAGSLDQVTEEQYRRVFDVSVWGVLNSMKHEIAAMLKNGGGAIVNTSSVFGHIGAAQASIYVAAKHAVEGLTKALALEFANQGIRINAVAPGVVDTEMIARVVGTEADRRNWLRSLHPVGRLGTTEEVAAAVLYLASDAAKFTTGTTLLVDGGWTAA